MADIRTRYQSEQQTVRPAGSDQAGLLWSGLNPVASFPQYTTYEQGR